MANNEFTVNGIDVRFKKINKDDYISLTDLARYANPSEPKVPIATWMRSKDVITMSKPPAGAGENRVSSSVAYEKKHSPML